MKVKEKLILLPTPREAEALDGAFEWKGSTELPDIISGGVPGRTQEVALVVDPQIAPWREGYALRIDSSGVRIAGHDEAGLFYGMQTLRQLLRSMGGDKKLPGLLIRDWPEFGLRGFTLDISRCKVPTMDTLRALADRLAEWKYNQLQLYTEHTFAYRDHETVWRDASPVTAAEIRELDAYCRERFIELVPNQNSLGHMERWLKHPEYRHLAENEEKLLTMAPAEATQEFMESLYRELLPNFSSGRFNIGCDEPWELGTGRSRELSARVGTGRVYLDYLSGICRRVQALGRTPMFWGDIIVKHPQLIPEIPENVIALLWGYEAHQPPDVEAEAFAEAGIPFVACPGTNAWHSLIGREESWRPNIERATRLARDYGALGMLLTEWGDNGHWQHWPVTAWPMAWAAEHLWRGGAVTGPESLCDAVALHAFGDATGLAGRGLLALSRAQGGTGVRIHNNSPLSLVLLKPGDAVPAGLTPDSIAEIERRIEEGLALVRESAMGCADAGLVRREVENGAAMARHACRVAREQLRVGGRMHHIEQPRRRELDRELRGVIEEFSELWLMRNRKGGLEESVGRFAGLVEFYRR